MLLAVSSAAIGCATVWLVWAGALAIWSWRATQPSPGLAAWIYYRSSAVPDVPWARYSSERIAATIWLVAVALLAAMAIARWRRTKTEWGVLAVIAGIVWSGLWINGQHRQAFYHWVNDAYPVTPRLPTAVAAWSLALWGVAAVAVASVAIVRPASPRWRHVGVGVALAAVTACTITAAALRAGDDSKFVDASTASPVPIAPLPARLGQQKFTIRISGWNQPTLRDPPWRVESAGAGFVTAGDEKVTAYGPDGKERWHYRRTGPHGLPASSFRVFDDGRTVVVGLDGNPASVLVGLDAMTGQQLWWSTDHAALAAFDSPRAAPQYLISASDDSAQWTRFDTRTGQRMWTHPAPAAECHGRYGGAPTLPGAAFRCAADPRPQVRFAEVDPATGDNRWETTLLHDIQVSDAPELTISPRATPAGRDGAVVITDVSPVGEHISTYVNLTTHHTRDLTELGRTLLWPALTHSQYSTSDVFLADGSDGFRLYGPDGQARCEFAERPMDAFSTQEDLALVLGDEIVFGASEQRGNDRADLLRTFHHSDCTPIATSSTASELTSLLAAPGVVLAVHTDQTGTYIDGYRE